MKKQYFVLFLLVFLIFPFVTSANSATGSITFSLNQTDYYFKTGENALITLTSDNTYGKSIPGLLSYTLTHSINQGNFQYSDSNSKSTTFSVKSGKIKTGFNFGTYDQPSTLTVNMKFSYNHNNKSMEVVLKEFKIHFVSDNSQKNNQQNQVKSSSQETQTNQQQNNNPLSQAQQQMRNQRQSNTPQTQNPQQALQNNQMPQDSSALKKQMQNTLREQQQMKDAFQKELAQNQDFQKENQNLLNQGYNITGANLNPTSNNSGDFKVNYQNQKGEQASLSGTMNNSQIQNLQKDTPELRQQMLNQLQQNKKFQNYQKQLQKQGFQQQNASFSYKQNQTDVQMNYQKNNETAKITGNFINNTIKKVQMNLDHDKKKKYYFWIPLLIVFLGVLAYVFYTKFNKKTKAEIIIEKTPQESPFNYKAEALSMLKQSKTAFDKEHYKEAYGLAAQASRLYLSYENNFKKEITNDEIVEILRKEKKEFKEAKACFDLCSLVEFAKYKANKRDFNKIMAYAKKIID